MARYEGSSEELARGLESKLGSRTVELLMDRLPPVGWSELATKKDVEALQLATRRDLEAIQVTNKKDHEILEHKLRAEIHRATRQLALTMTTVFAVLNGVMFTALFTALKPS
jgi:hypothetical protein